MRSVVKFAGTFVVAIIIGAVVIALSGRSPLDAYVTLFSGAFGSINSIADTLLAATPLIFTGLATGVAFKAGVFNVGVEGSLYLGAFAAAWVGFTFTSLPGPAIIVLAFVLAGIVGAAWCLIPAYLKVKFRVDEVVTTIMLNYVAILFTSYLVNYPFLPPGVANSMSAEIAPQAHLARLAPPSQLNVSFVIALAAAGIIAWGLSRTTLGYEIRIAGSGPDFAKQAGISVPRVIFLSMLISGFLGGVGGAGQVLGVNYRFIDGFSPGYGFDGITVALLARNNPVGIVVAAILFGALRNGASTLQLFTSIPISIVDILQATVIFFVTADVGIRLTRRRRSEQRGIGN